MWSKQSKSNVIEELKTEAKEYYKWKNMTVRYIILWFLCLLLIIQLIWPYKKDKNTINQKNLDVTVDSWFQFLWETYHVHDFDPILWDRIWNEMQWINIETLYKQSQFFLPEIKEILAKNGIPSEFSYIPLLANMDLPYRNLPDSVRSYGGITISPDIDERFHTTKSTIVFSEYLNELYDEYEDWNLVMIAYFIWKDTLDDIISTQDTEYEDMYIPMPFKVSYYKVLYISYLFDNIDKYIDIEKVQLYPEWLIKIIKVSEQKDLMKWCDKNWYQYKTIMELNPWILWNTLPKWKRELIVPK